MVREMQLEAVDSPEFLDTLYTILASSRRRDVLRYLLANESPASEYRLALELAAASADSHPEAVSPEEQHEFTLHLRHVDLPLLHETGVVRWDRDTGQVTLEPILEQLTLTLPDSESLVDLAVSIRSEVRN